MGGGGGRGGGEEEEEEAISRGTALAALVTSQLWGRLKIVQWLARRGNGGLRCLRAWPLEQLSILFMGLRHSCVVARRIGVRCLLQV